ncbi:tRNA 2-selenouridine(34) synthase MnmH [Massilia sp. TS11]|uniref:tRNA 2-selenouridine(34) synthase MnmH n=1 Tax=Massilia sp. TS11 TaxID=2908003 RepID=UPI001EDBCC80|nr:tRNA 2-selenouridine(34) synthase MnmH [Massilia sp. TS11]MCG2584676.1 tRNA 2-selenouridine(34) synthase MnmH [Massilia sp. TS11]
MKYPLLLGIDAVLPELDRYDSIIDVRSPDEFAEDHIPGAINLPVLDNEERARVGTIYKQQSPFEAKKIGAALVARNIGMHIEQQLLDKPRDWKPLIYCWRGGNRSGSMATVLSRIGWPVVQLDGGYKAYRTALLQALDQLPPLQFRAVCGTTGCGKSRLLNVLESIGAQVLDLEGIAVHRGSVLGNVPDAPQPPQKWFESMLWDKLRHFDPALPVFVESESKKVGSLRVPDALMEAIRQAPVISLQLSHEKRVQLLMEDYRHFIADPAALNRQLDCLVKLHGRAKIDAWHALANSGQMAQLVGELLVDHYDPAYLKSIERNFVHYPRAQQVELADITPDAFLALARQLHPG